MDISQIEIAGKKLYKRIHGKTFNVNQGSNTILYTIPYDIVKISGLHIVNCEALDMCNFKVLDSENGKITTVPNYQLNQFGFDVVLPKDFYSYESEYPSDIVKDLQIKIEYVSISNKTIGINFIMNEVK